MNQQEYLQRLKNIRGKYNCPNEYVTLTKNVKQNSYRQPMFDLNIKKCNSIQKESRRNMNIHSENEENREQRLFSRKVSNSLNKMKEFDKDSQHGRSREKINRPDFSTFIKDLDKKIAQKEKFLHHKLKNNNKKYQYNIELHRQIQNQQNNISPIKRKNMLIQNSSILNKHNSAKYLDTSILISKSISKINSRAELQQSPEKNQLNKAIQHKIYQKHFKNESNDNYIPSKYYKQPQMSKISSKYAQHKLNMIQNQKLNNFIQIKLNNDSHREKYHQKENNFFSLHPKQNYQALNPPNQQFNKNNWSSSNFQKIQQRIKSVLKQANR